ncbi:MAG TPA: autotransporter domain-containing protein [Casimicrobiaceae bacterium]|nr:autotransporter domain-containing protein [Casimicrobiaceae bacterium]
MTKKTLVVCALGASGLLAQGEASAQFNQFYFLGDSLSDAGTYGARFTVNPGLVWAQDLGAKYGVVVTPWNQGGIDAAQGGARVTQPSPFTPSGAPQRPLSVQIDQLLQATPNLNANTLYTVFIGADDIFVNVSAAAAGQITPAQVQTNVATAATQTLQQIARLRDAGARTIMVFNLGDIGQTPAGRASDPATLSALSTLFNSTLQAGLASLNVNIIPVNLFGFLNEVSANPTAVGLTNVTAPACTTSGAITCTTATLVAPNAAQTYLWADATGHLTPAGHQLIADFAAAEINAPQQMGLLANAPVQAEQANFRALDDRMWSNLNMPRAQSTFEAYAVYDYGNTDLNGSVGGGNTHANSVLVGGDMKISEQFLAGIAFGYTQDKASLGNSAGGFTLNDATLTFYAGYGSGPWYVGATIGGGSLDYTNIHRSFSLGQATRTENSTTNGSQFIVRALGGYWFNSGGDWLHGPYVRLTYQDIKVDQFAESGTSSSAMYFQEQKYDPFSTSLGWQAAGSVGSVRLFGRASWEYNNSSNDNRNVTAGVVSMPGTFALPAYKFDNSYGLFLIGASAPLGGTITGFISGAFSAWNGSGNYQAVTVGIRVPL